MRLIITLLALLLPLFSFAQQPVQSIRGQVNDKESKSPLIGANVIVYIDSVMLTAGSTDELGNYRIDDVPVGRVNVRYTYIGYDDVWLNNIIVTAGKEVILQVEMEEWAETLIEVVISSQNDKG